MPIADTAIITIITAITTINRRENGALIAERAVCFYSQR